MALSVSVFALDGILWLLLLFLLVVLCGKHSVELCMAMELGSPHSRTLVSVTKT